MVPILSIVGKMGLSWFQHRQEKQNHQMKVECARNQAQIARVQADQEHEQDLDEYFAKKHGTTQKVILYIFMVPAILAFIGYDEAVMQGFKALDAMPQWYQAALGLMIVAIWGFRGLLSKLLAQKIGGAFGRRKNGNGNGNGG